MRNEQEIIKGCINKDSKYQKILYETYSTKMMNVCLRYAKNDIQAFDLFQEGFVNVLLNIKKFRFKSSLETWMTRIFINVALSNLKKQKSRNRLFTKSIHEEIENIADEDNEIELFSDKIDAKNILEILNDLPEGYKTIINLYLFDDYSHKEIAKLLKISSSTSRSQLFKAKKYLKSLILKYKNEGE